MQKWITGLLVLIVMSSAAFAQDDTLKCNPEGTQIEMNVCAAEDYQKADKKLNETWKKLMVKFKNDKTATTNLKKAQKAWVAFRDADIEAMFSCASGDRVCWGSMESMLRSGELQAMTEARTKRLQHYIDNGLGSSEE